METNAKLVRKCTKLFIARKKRVREEVARRRRRRHVINIIITTDEIPYRLPYRARYAGLSLVRLLYCRHRMVRWRRLVGFGAFPPTRTPRISPGYH